MPGSFNYGSVNIVKRYGGDPAIPVSYKFDCLSNLHVLGITLSNADPNEVTLKLFLDNKTTFVSSQPILIDESSKWNYLIECYLKQGATSGKFFRCRIKNAVKTLDERHGIVLQVSCEGVEVRVKESPVSHPKKFNTPAYALTSYIADYNRTAQIDQEKLYGNGVITNDKVVTAASTTVLLDDAASLKQNWIPGGIKTYYDIFEMIIQRSSLSPPQGGTNKEYFIDYEYPNNEFGNSDKKWIKMIAKEFGLQDSGITITPKSFANPESQGTEIVDNTKYFDKVILECDSTSGSLPMDRTRILSDIEHGKYRDEYDHTKTYGKDDVIKWADKANKRVRFYKSLKDNNTAALPVGTAPDSNASWDEDVYRSNAISPLTNNLEIWKANISAFKAPHLGSGHTDTLSAVSASSGYIGMFPDPNFVRVNSDRGDLPYYYTITLKDVTRILTGNSGIPTGSEVHDGQRILVGLDKSVPVTTAPFAANKQKIAEYDAHSKKWIFSKNPEDDDVVSDHSTARLYRYKGTFPNGSWTILWDINSGAGWQTTPWHPVKSMKLTDDSNGVKNAAVEFLFNWNTDLLTGGDARNRYSRGWWLAFYNPTPRRHISSKYPIGKVFKKPFLDTNNMRYATDGTIGFSDIRGEDHGPIQGKRMTLTSSIEDSNNRPLDFKANQKIIFWVLDKYMHVHYAEEEINANGKPQTFILAYGANSSQNLWVNRVDDLEIVYGLTIPAFFGLSQEERSGIVFDWEFVRGWGCFYADSYSDEPRYYTGGADSYVQDLGGRLNVVYEYFINSFQSLFTPSDLGPAIVLADHAKIKIEDLHDIKQLIVMSDDDIVDNPHIKILQDQNVTDYNNAKIIARSEREKAKVFRPVRHITSDLDVRLQKGMRFATSDGRKWAVISVKQIIDDDGATMEIVATPRLVFT